MIKYKGKGEKELGCGRVEAQAQLNDKGDIVS